MRNMFRFFLFLLIFTQALMANEQEDLQKHFVKKLDEVILVVRDDKLSTDNRNSNIISLLTPMFDFKLMAKLSLGKRAWSNLNDNEKDNFVNLYVKRMKNSYSSKINSYKDEKIEVTKVESKKNRIAITTDVVNNHDKLEVVYKYYKPRKPKVGKDTWLIYDVEIIGVSILKADKAQFREFLKTKSISQLIDKLAQN